jgi:hypothetical protein
MSAKKDNAVKIPQNNPTTKINNPTKYQKNPSLMDDPKQWLNKHPIASIALAA